jgi:hypothetical protein
MENRFIRNSENTILDKKTNFEWKSDWDEIERSNFNNLKLKIDTSANNWHIPSIDEFKSLSKDMKKLPSARYLKKIGFTGVSISPYWSSTSTDSFLGQYIVFFIFYFFTFLDHKADTEYRKFSVTLVRKNN